MIKVTFVAVRELQLRGMDRQYAAGRSARNAQAWVHTLHSLRVPCWLVVGDLGASP